MNDCATLVELLERRAAEAADAVGFTYFADGERESATLTYGALLRDARRLAARLVDAGMTGERVLLVSAPGLEFLVGFFGCVLAGAVAVPVPPPHPVRPERSAPRLRAILRNAAPRGGLAPAAMIEALGGVEELAWLATDAPGGCAGPGLASVDPGDLAFLQYTSGSTAEPKGVMVTHANLLHNLSCIHWFSENDRPSRGVSWLPLHHDMGLIEGVLQPLFGGYPVWLMPPAAFLQKPLRWLQALSRVGGTNSGAPDFAYALCARRATAADVAALDLSAWRVAYNGSEPVRAATIEAFVRRFGASGFRSRAFYPVYGLAEATLVVTSCRSAEEPAVTADGAVGCGRTTGGTEVRIVDPERCSEVALGAIGEIWVRGASVGVGYWGRPELTAEIFGATLVSGDGPFLRTGDLGGVRSDGELVVAGRRKDLIILRGCKLHPADLEATVDACHPAMQPGSSAACGVPGDGGEALAILVEVPEALAAVDAQVLALGAAIRREVALDHGVQVEHIVAVGPRALPRTTSGKLQRYLCREWVVGGAPTVLAACTVRGLVRPGLPAAVAE